MPANISYCSDRTARCRNRPRADIRGRCTASCDKSDCAQNMYRLLSVRSQRMRCVTLSCVALRCMPRVVVRVVNVMLTRAVQPVATCRQSPYLHKPAVIVTSFSLRRLAPSLAAHIPIMTPFSLWRHSLLSWPRPPLQTYEHLPRLIYKDVAN